jgi:predicted DNA-binding transcriptional regulator AlpA
MRREREPEPPLMISRRELARLLGVTERHVQNLDRRGVFKPLRLGASVRYVRAEVEETIRRLAEEDGK